MSDPDDDDGSLQPLRAVWLSMRDEEPPAGGMAALMAAAREQAEKMRRPSPWQRFVSALRTPPVLALAGVAVLVSGALVLGDRRNEMSAPMHSAPTREIATGTSSPPAADDGDERDSANLEAAPMQAPVAPEPASRPAPVAASPASPRRKQVVEPAPPLAAPLRTHDDAHESRELPSSGQPEGVGARAPASEPTVTVDATARPGARPPSIMSLAKQAEIAAGRGDCVGAKQHAQQLARADRSAYESLVQRNAALARCLRE